MFVVWHVRWGSCVVGLGLGDVLKGRGTEKISDNERESRELGNI